jgi:hypothetical protein
VETRIHQAAYGYDRGHRLLASSVKLTTRDAELLARLSDLSGALLPNLSVAPYLSFFPTESYYAICRTWLDEDAPRSGCVITHILLLAKDLWAALPRPQDLSHLLIKPSRAALDSFQKPITFHPQPTGILPSQSVDGRALSDFVVKLFSEGRQPLVWFDCEEPENIAWALCNFGWPTLRRVLSICTFCLQPRTLADQPFSLMFAPSAARPRFNTLPKGCFVDRTSTSASTQSRDTWVPLVVDYLAGKTAAHPLTSATEAVGNVIEPDPALVRNLFLLQDLVTRLAHSSTAGVALLDVLDSLGSETKKSSEFKAQVILKTIEYALAGDPAEALQALLLLNERLSRQTAEPSEPALAMLRQAVARLTANAPESAITVLGSRPSIDFASGHSAFVDGCFDGLEQLSTVQPVRSASLLFLEDYPDIGSSAVVSRPQLALAFLEASHLAGRPGGNLLAVWISNSASSDERERLREVLIAGIHQDEDRALVDELLRDISETDVPSALERLFVSTGGFESLRLRDTISQRLASTFPLQVQSWAHTTALFSTGSADLVAATYPGDSSGLAEITSQWSAGTQKSGLVVASFVERVLASNRNNWFSEYCKQDCAFVDALLTAAPNNRDGLRKAIERLFTQCPEVPVAQRQHLLPIVQELASANGFDNLVAAAAASAVREFIRGSISDQNALEWQSTSWGSSWLRFLQSSKVEELLTRSIRGTDDWHRAWRWVAIAPAAFYHRPQNGIADALRTLSFSRSSYFEMRTSRDWSAALFRSRQLSDRSGHLRVSADSLQFAFNHTWLPLSAVVAAAFSDVYNAVTQSPKVPDEVSGLFGFLNWDKAKELRSRLVDSYYESRAWPPGDLALSVYDDALLRKLYRRVKRKRHGDLFVQNMISDLASRADDRSQAVANQLVTFDSDQNFYEPWD